MVQAQGNQELIIRKQTMIVKNTQPIEEVYQFESKVGAIQSQYNDLAGN